jgi:glutamate-ammonia-ligase adenylyltransferase
LPEFSAALTELAEVVLDQSVRDCQTKLSHAHGWPLLPDGRPCPFAIFGMGKFGGRELGYASDIEVLFVYGGPGKTDGREPLENSEYFERLVQELLRWIEAKQEGIFHLDVRLRPHGGKGLLANRVDELRTYYSPQGLAAPFERQALIKLRHGSGDGKLGRLVEDHRNRYVYSDEPFDLRAALDLRSRQVAELVEPDKTNIKFSPGGLIDLEYAVQYLQLLHGHRHPELRTPNTLEAVDALTRVRLLTAHEGNALRESYLFFRMLIDGLRIVRGHAKDLVLPPDESEAFVFLARRIGYTTEAWEEGAAKLKEDIHRHMDRTRRFFETRFGKVSAR